MTAVSDSVSKKVSNYKLFCNVVFRLVAFTMIGIVIFATLQSILVPKRYTYNNMYDAGKLTNFYNEEKDGIDVLIEGTSHSSGGILPMELYENYGIKSYNLATGTQPIEVTYYMAREALKTQAPKVLVFDVGNLYISDATEFYWRIVLDEMQYGKNKVSFAYEYCRKYLDKDKLAPETLFPLLYYHNNWKNLSRQNFEDSINNKHSYDKGGIMTSTIASSWMTVEYMNEMTETLLQDNEQFLYIYDGDELSENYNENVLYSADIDDKNIIWFKKLQELCETKGVQLLAVKVPSINLPQSYRSAWTKEKYSKVKKLCEELGISYYDLLYEADVEIDWEKDTWDGGQHLNLNGAMKISADLGEYLREHYNLSDKHNEQWNRDLTLYQQVRNVALLELEQDFHTYVTMLINEFKDKLIFIAASDDMANELNESDIAIMRSLGLKMDYTEAFHNSYIAVIEKGEVLYEALSNRPLNYGGLCSLSNRTYELYSAGWLTNAQASIKLDGIEFAVNSRGLNIVVYDDEKGLVLDSVAFDTYSEDHTPSRNNGMVNGFRQEFERYLMETGDA